MTTIAAAPAASWHPEKVSHAEQLIEELYESHWSRMVRLAALLLSSSDHAEEVAQDAFIQIFQRAHQFQSANDAVGYLRTCVVNGARSVHRHRAVVRRLQPPPPPDPSGPEEIALQSAADQATLAALQQIPQRQREVLILRFWSQLSGPEIGAALGISQGAVKSHTHRGLAALRTQLTSKDQ